MPEQAQTLSSCGEGKSQEPKAESQEPGTSIRKSRSRNSSPQPPSLGKRRGSQITALFSREAPGVSWEYGFENQEIRSNAKAAKRTFKQTSHCERPFRRRGNLLELAKAGVTTGHGCTFKEIATLRYRCVRNDSFTSKSRLIKQIRIRLTVSSPRLILI